MGASATSSQAAADSASRALLAHVRTAVGAPLPASPTPAQAPAGAAVLYPGHPLAAAIARGHLTCLRAPPYDAFQRLVLPVPLLTPPWYLGCKVCRGYGHFEADCPVHAGAFMATEVGGYV